MLSVKDISLSFGHKKLFENVTITFTPGCRYGIIGANGTGKSTFLKIITGEQSADRGSIFLDPKAKLGWQPRCSFKELVRLMVFDDLKLEGLDPEKLMKQ